MPINYNLGAKNKFLERHQLQKSSSSRHIFINEIEFIVKILPLHKSQVHFSLLKWRGICEGICEVEGKGD